MIKVLIADDSPTCLQYLQQLLSADLQMDIVGCASTGQEAIKLTRSLRPDVVVMDLFMPDMDGFQTTKEIMQSAPTPIVIVSARANPSDCRLSLEALNAGALAMLSKPKLADSSFEQIALEFSRTVRSLADVKVVKQYRPGKTQTTDKGTDQAKRSSGVKQFAPSQDCSRFKPQVVAIAASTGGPPALSKIISNLPADLNVPILIVQHISNGFVQGLADWLNARGPLTVKVAEQGESLRPGTAYLAPDNYHLGMDRNGSVVLSSDPKINGFRPSGTHLFASVAEAVQGKVLAAILTGMGDDGASGLAQLRRQGGRVIAQDSQTCIVFGMPAAAIELNCVDKVLPLDEIAAEIARLCRDD